jgi:hypothetical protein
MPDRISPTTSPPDPSGRHSGTADFDRLARALRENLKKRKEQKREREKPRSGDGADDPSVVPREEHITDIEI